MPNPNCNKCECDRQMVCDIVGCFLNHPDVLGLPKFLSKQIKDARSPKQALQIFRFKTLYNATKKNQRQAI